MSDEDSFLARWARRKRAVAATKPGQSKPKNTADGTASEAPAASLPSEETQSPFDPTSLPPIESIGAGSDIRPFLAAGVPAELTRAALRHAWSADPGIRDFIGLSENSWDFNAPGGVPGFGSLTAEDARRLLARAMEATESLDPARPAVESLSEDEVPMPTDESGQRAPGSVPAQLEFIRDPDAGHRDPMPTGNIPVQHEREEREAHLPLPRPRHGGALPD